MAVLGGWRLTRAGVLFVVGILVLGGLVTGGVFLVKNHGEAVRRDQAVKVAEQSLKDQSQVATQTVKDSDTSSSNADQSSSNAASTDNGSTATAGSTASELPETGIDGLQSLVSIFVVALLAFSVASFVTSRRAAHNL